MISCPDCGTEANFIASNYKVMPLSVYSHKRGGIQCLEQQVKNLKEENKRLSAEFTGKLTQPPLEMIRAKCEQYWNVPNSLCPEEMHVILEFIYQLARSAEKGQKGMIQLLKEQRDGALEELRVLKQE